LVQIKRNFASLKLEGLTGKVQHKIEHDEKLKSVREGLFIHLEQNEEILLENSKSTLSLSEHTKMIAVCCRGYLHIEIGI